MLRYLSLLYRSPLPPSICIVMCADKYGQERPAAVPEKARLGVMRLPGFDKRALQTSKRRTVQGPYGHSALALTAYSQFNPAVSARAECPYRPYQCGARLSAALACDLLCKRRIRCSDRRIWLARAAILNCIVLQCFQRKVPPESEYGTGHPGARRLRVLTAPLERVRRIAHDGTIATDAAMLYATLRDHMGDQSEDAGFEQRWTPKAGRRGSGNAANGTLLSCLVGDGALTAPQGTLRIPFAIR
jgi:hypothetical protein